MRANMNQARAFGRRVAGAQDAALRDQESLREARALWLAPARPPRRGRSRFDWRLWGGMGTAVSLAAAAVLLFFGRTPASRLAFQVGPSEQAVAGATAKPGIIGELVAAPDRERLPVRFSDGSVVRLEHGARARFVEVTDNGSRVLLESGVAHANVVHRGETRWTVQAGSFEVHVTGTEFDIAWDPPRGLFSITLQEGRVLVSGCAMDQARVVAAGETFRATCKDDERARTPVVTPPASPIPSPIASAPLSPSSSIDEATRQGSTEQATRQASSIATPPSLATGIAKSPSTALPTPALQPTWRELLALHRYAEAFDVADGVGLSSICASADVAALMDLSDAARFAGHADRAKVVLQEVRRRFGGDERATTAAFNLGRIAFDDESAYADAARWFDLYLTEHPAGPLAREASGRRMEALERAGDHPAAKRAAVRYIEDFPAGPHAEVARSIAAR
jgi:FecR protein